MSSYYVQTLHTSVLVDPALDIIHGRLQQYPQLCSRTALSIHNFVSTLEFCLKSTFFTFQGKYYKHVHGIAMDSPINSLRTNLFMKDLNPEPSSPFPNHPGSGLGTWMTPSSSTRQNTPSNSSPTLTH